VLNEKIGKLNTGVTRSSGKVIDEWEFRSPFTDARAPALKVTVSIVKSSSEGITFCVRGDNLVDMVDTDIERLRQRVCALFQQQHDIAVGVAWEDWLEVAVSGDSRHFRAGSEKAGVEVLYRRLKRGVDAATGLTYTLSINGTAIPFPQPKQSGVNEDGVDYGDWKGMSDRDVETEFSYLPATPENIASLNELMDRVTSLRAKLSEFLRQDTVQESLTSSIDGVLVLAAPI
jgi:hypothetical protein